MSASHFEPCIPLESIADAIRHAAHYLPGQGPITVFIHHNTLHALEDLPFEQAVWRGAELFGCRAFLTEERYRKEVARGRIRSIDLSESLWEILGDEAEIFIGFLGTRFNLRLAMLHHPLHTVLPNELEWVVAENQAFSRFSPQSDPGECLRMVENTRRWVTHMLSQPAVTDVRGELTYAHEFRDLWASLDQSSSTHHVATWPASSWERCTLQLLWQICFREVSKYPSPANTRQPVRHRDILLATTGVDSDALVHEVLIRFGAVLLDQGLSQWTLPNRTCGILRAFTNLYAARGALTSRWLRPLRQEWERIERAKLSALEVIQKCLCDLGVKPHEVESFLTQTLLALRGYAGMIWQMECRADRVAHGLPPGSLVEFVALRLVLDRLAVRHVASRELGMTSDLKSLRGIPLEASPDDHAGRVRCEAFAVFQLAQALGWQPESLFKLPSANWRKLLEEIRLFDEKQRLYVFQLAYERKFRQQCLDAIGTSGRAASIGKLKFSPPDPWLDVLTCIDEREESFRRHLEEIDPDCRTWGTAGFFGVAMYYKGADSFQYVPLCPIVIEPQHFVQECVFQDHAEANTKRSIVRRAVGRLLHGLHAGSRLLFSGAMASLLGALAALPMVARVLLPRWAGSFRERVSEWFAVPEATYLQVEREDQKPGSINCQTGYTLDEMVTIVERLLRDIGLTRNFARLLVVLGHGSTSLNNPHESAHDCGACGGGRGGPNARAWALMANDPRVRERLRYRGLSIPDSTFIVGGYHNTCDDSVTLYDVDRVPTSHTDELCRARRVFEEACLRNAHERCRRFESADLTLDQHAALRHVRARVEDLSQVRPEYGHATNALCIVGRRELTRHLFLDRRAFLQSYDPAQDDAEHSILLRILAAVVPVCAGINLEYYFSYIDPDGYGCGTKLPHNITSLVGVMNGAASDLRPGLPWQMVEIHEPVRLLIIIETTPEIMWSIMARNPMIDRLVRGHWVQLVTWNAEQAEFHRYRRGEFERYVGESSDIPLASTSSDWYRGWRGDLEFAQIVPVVDHDEALAH